MNTELNIDIDQYTFDICVTHYHVQKPNRNADSDWDYDGYTDLEYNITANYEDSLLMSTKEADEVADELSSLIETKVQHVLDRQIESDYDGDY